MFVFKGKNNNFEYLTMVIMSEQRLKPVIVDLGDLGWFLTPYSARVKV